MELGVGWWSLGGGGGGGTYHQAIYWTVNVHPTSFGHGELEYRIRTGRRGCLCSIIQGGSQHIRENWNGVNNRSKMGPKLSWTVPHTLEVPWPRPPINEKNHIYGPKTQLLAWYLSLMSALNS